MSAPHVVVIGSGFAGMAAAFAAKNAGAEVTIVLGRAGASAFYAGAVDAEPWDDVERAAATMSTPLIAPALDEEIVDFATALGLWTVPETGASLPRLVTTAGVVRTTRAHDAALLDLRSAAARTILVPRAERAGWDADSIARCARAAVPATSATFEAVAAPVLRFDEERDIVDMDLAARHDDPARLAWLAEQLKREIARRGVGSFAVLLGPWLGATKSRAAELSALVGVPCGEALAATSGTAGNRFETVRPRLVAALGARVVEGLVVEIATPREPAALTVSVEGGLTVRASSVVLATGGLVGGGITYDPPEHGATAEGPERARSPFRATVRADGLRAAHAGDPGIGASIHGPALDDRTWPRGTGEGVLERAGLLVQADGKAAPGIFAAGDVVFGRRRTVLAAVGSGLRAGHAAFAHALRTVTSVA